MNIIDISIKRPITILMVMLALVIFGLMAYVSLPVSLLPDTKVPIVTIQTIYPGASPQVVEEQLSKKIENQVFSIGELDSLTSYSLDSLSLITITFNDGKDENLALQEVKDKVDAIMSQLPRDIEKPSISKVDIASSAPIMNILLEGNMDPTELFTLGSTSIRDQLAQVPGVGNIRSFGGVEREIRVELDRGAVFERYLSAEQTAAILGGANIELPSGNIEVDNQDIPVRFKGEFDSLESIGDLDISTNAGIFKLRQLGTISDTHVNARERVIFRDKEAGTRKEGVMLLQVMKNPTANTVAVVDGVAKRLPRIEENIGENISLRIIREDAGFIRDSVNDTLSNLILGIILTGLVLLVFLHDWRSTLILSLAMPLSIVSTFLVMQAMGISVNVLSLMGLSCAVGTLVANSVVVLENIFRCKSQGLSRIEAASRGAKGVMMAVLASTLTNVAVFVPLGGMAGAMGQILSHFAYTVVISTVFSIIVSFTLTPLLASRMLPEQLKEPGRIGRAIDRGFKALEDLYRKSLAVILKRKRRSALVGTAVFAAFVLSLIGFTKIPMELVPQSDGGKINVSVELPLGSSLESTAGVLREIEERLVTYDEVDTLLTSLGLLGSMDIDVNVAMMQITLKPKDKRRRSNLELAALMTRTLSDIPGAVIRVSAPAELAIAQGSPIDLYLQGADNQVLQELGTQIKNRIDRVEGIMSTGINTKAGKNELVFEPRRKQISQDGLSVQSVAVSLRAAVDGLVAATYREGGEEFDIRVKMKDSALADIEDLRNIPIASSRGVYPLSRYADLHFESGYNKIMRSDKLRTVEITAELLPGYTQGPVTADVMKTISDIDLPAGYSVKQAGLSDAMEESNRSMAIVFLTAILLVYMLLAAVLENPVQPLFILLTIPLSIIGVAAACLITSSRLNNIAMIGIVMLVGIVVNNAILILDYYNQLKREEGLNTADALIKACPVKLKAILMSNIAIILGLLPMALGIGASLAEMRQPMGVIVIGGIISSTILTLWFIPAIEYLVSRRSRLEGRKI
ncbi:efflux RND transporter permease subunit [Treponema sp. OttesenSCG-928-L16]|nr:efflux RND transporter permease subunit [Treponema sp. OttesenSCG-928-L16]